MSTFIICRTTYVSICSIVRPPGLDCARISRARNQRPETAMTSLTEEQARATIAPWCSLFNVASRGDVKAIQEQVLKQRITNPAQAICRENAGAARPRSRWFRISRTPFPTWSTPSRHACKSTAAFCRMETHQETARARAGAELGRL
jgi:hypothetical protein